MLHIEKEFISSLISDVRDELQETYTAAWEDDPGAALDASASALRSVERLQSSLVLRSREHGLTWAMIGDRLGVSAQAAQQRYGVLTRG